MGLRSLGRRTDLMFARATGEVTDRGDYLLVRTPSNPGYHWGNYLIFREPPAAGDHDRWTALFRQEFPGSPEQPSHLLFAWDVAADKNADNTGAAAEFLEHDMRFDTAVVLTAAEVTPPPRPNPHVEIATISGERAWREVIEQQIETRLPEFSLPAYRAFKEAQCADYRRMSEAGLGHWYGAYLDGCLVANLGIFQEGGVARYQAVTTLPSHRRQGICGTLVHRAAALLAVEAPIDTFVMEADPEYHAARIYESVGFERSEVNHALYWHREMPPCSQAGG